VDIFLRDVMITSLGAQHYLRVLIQSGSSLASFLVRVRSCLRLAASAPPRAPSGPLPYVRCGTSAGTCSRAFDKNRAPVFRPVLFPMPASPSAVLRPGALASPSPSAVVLVLLQTACWAGRGVYGGTFYRIVGRNIGHSAEVLRLMMVSTGIILGTDIIELRLYYAS
jgi:hypothetical protein